MVRKFGLFLLIILSSLLFMSCFKEDDYYKRAEIDVKIAEINALIDTERENTEESIDNLISEYSARIDELKNEISDADNTDEINALEKELTDKIDALLLERDEKIADLEMLIDVLRNHDLDFDERIETIEAAITEIKASIIIPTYTVTFDSRGGSAVNSQSIKSGCKLTKPEEPLRDGYLFDGWYIDGERWVFIGYTVDRDMSLVAKWTAKQYSITYELLGGTIADAPTDYTIESEPFSIPIPEKVGYVFAGWTKNDDTEPRANLTIPKGSFGDLHLKACWMNASNGTEVTFADIRYDGNKYAENLITASGIVTHHNENERTVYVQQYSTEIEDYIGMKIIYGAELCDEAVKLLSVGNEVRFTGRLSYDSSAEEFFVTDIIHDLVDAKNPDNVILIESGTLLEYSKATKVDFASGIVSLTRNGTTKYLDYSLLRRYTAISFDTLTVNAVTTSTVTDYSKVVISIPGSDDEIVFHIYDDELKSTLTPGVSFILKRGIVETQGEFTIIIIHSINDIQIIYQ